MEGRLRRDGPVGPKPCAAAGSMVYSFQPFPPFFAANLPRDLSKAWNIEQGKNREGARMGRESLLRRYGLPVLTGLVVGLGAVLLAVQGNPRNMGLCVACFLRDIAGALNLQRAGYDAEMGAGVVQYIRPEIIGLVLGSTAAAFLRRGFRPRGGSAPMLRFTIAVFVMVGALIFLGCPLRMLIRLGGGDLNALVGLAGLVIGVLIGGAFLHRGFALRRPSAQSMAEGLIFPVLMAALLVLLLRAPGFIAFSRTGPGALHAPVLLALGVTAVMGVLAQRTRLCAAGAVQDVLLRRDYRLLSALAAILLAVAAGNLLSGLGVQVGFAQQPAAHTEWLWNLLGMVLVGWGSVLLGGCPLRQLILAGEGNTDSAVTVTGFLVGAALAHNFDLVSTSAGIGGGPVLQALAAGLVFFLAVSLTHSARGRR